MQVKLKISFILLISFLVNCNAQKSSEPPPAKNLIEENWDTYMAAYENNMPGTVTLRMDLIKTAPLKFYPYLLKCSKKYTPKDESGLPNNKTLEILYAFSDSMVNFIISSFESIHIGSFMYNGERSEYFYIHENSGVIEKVEKYTKAQDFTNTSIQIKVDSAWKTYTESLFPNQETQDFMGDEKVVMNLQQSGDNLTEARRVDHWAYFMDAKNMTLFKESIKKEGYNIEKTQLESKEFAIQFWKVSKVDMSTIHPITTWLRKLAKKYNGNYDGWETFVIK